MIALFDLLKQGCANPVVGLELKDHALGGDVSDSLLIVSGVPERGKGRRPSEHVAGGFGFLLKIGGGEGYPRRPGWGVTLGSARLFAGRRGGGGKYSYEGRNSHQAPNPVCSRGFSLWKRDKFRAPTLSDLPLKNP